MTDLEMRFWDKVKIGDGCWEWTACKNNRGYGMFFIGRRVGRIGAHRLAFSLELGMFPRELAVCHRCDNPGCVRPSHLFLGTDVDNMRDCMSKGRYRGGGPPGEACGTSKLRECDIRDIRAMRGHRSQEDIASMFGVTQTAISCILRRKTWDHVKD